MLLELTEEEYFIRLGRLVRDNGIDDLFDTSQTRDAKSWNRYYQLRKGIEEDYKEIFGHEPR
jgi:hypothetical protein